MYIPVHIDIISQEGIFLYFYYLLTAILRIIDVRYQLSTVFGTSLLLENRWNHDNGRQLFWDWQYQVWNTFTKKIKVGTNTKEGRRNTNIPNFVFFSFLGGSTLFGLLNISGNCLLSISGNCLLSISKLSWWLHAFEHKQTAVSWHTEYENIERKAHTNIPWTWVYLDRP